MKIKTTLFNSSDKELIDIGFERFWVSDTSPENWISELGQLLLRTDYPQLFKFAHDNNLLVTDEDWNTQKLYGFFSTGTDETNFRIPDMRGFQRVGFEQGYHKQTGQYIQDQIVNITGGAFIEAVHSNFYGAFYDNGILSGTMGNNKHSANGGIAFDASRVVKTGARVQTRAITGNWLIKYR